MYHTLLMGTKASTYNYYAMQPVFSCDVKSVVQLKRPQANKQAAYDDYAVLATWSSCPLQIDSHIFTVFRYYYKDIQVLHYCI